MEIDELFDFNDDFSNDKYSQHDIQDQNAVKETELTLLTILLNCAEDRNDSRLVLTKDFKAVLSHEVYTVPDEMELFNFKFEDDPRIIDDLIKMGRSNVQKLSSSVIDSLNPRTHLLNTRQSVTKLMLLLRINYKDVDDEHLKVLRVLFGTFNSMLHLPLVQSFSSEGDKSPSYHLLHGQLEWRYIYLTILYKIEFSRGVLGSEDSDFNCETILLTYDLITLSISMFNKCDSANIFLSSPFVCTCVKEMWICLQMMLLQDSNVNFWKIVSNILHDLRFNKHSYENFPTKKILLRGSSVLTCKSIDLFSIWLVCGLVKLMDNKTDIDLSQQDSYKLTENFIKTYLNSEPSEENLRVLLLIISDVIFEVWPPRSEIMMTLWEYLHRKINSPFFISGQNLNLMAVSSGSAATYLEKIKSQQATTTKLNANTTSYDMFIHLLGKLVIKFTQEGQKVQVQKILGRIYTKFPASKFQTLTELGIHNILKLLITLSISTDFKDIAKKVSDTVLSASFHKMNHQQQLMKGHMALLILFSENHLNITQYLTKLMTQVNHLTEKSSSSVNSVLKIIAEALPVIVMRNSDDDTFENGEHLLFDSWIVDYLVSATSAEQERVFDTLTSIIQKIRDLNSPLGSPNITNIVQKLFKVLLPHCKQSFEKTESIGLPLMMAQLCLLSADYQYFNSKELPKFENIFKSCLEINCASIDNSISFMKVILENREKIEKLDSQLDKLAIMQHWIKYSVLVSGGNNILKELTRYVIKLDEITSLSDTAKSQPDEFLNSKEPLCTFLTDVGRKYLIANNQTKLQIIERIHGYFSNFEKWALPILQLQQQYHQPSGNRSQTAVSTDESVMRIYTFISITVLHCSEIIYIRSKTRCFFNVAISHFILPPSLMMNQSQPRFIIVSMYKVWPLLIEGISKLDYKNDQHIGKVLNDLIVKWAPLLKISSNSKVVSKPFLNVTNLNNGDIIEFVYGKLAKSYIALQNRKPSPSACMILTIIEEVLHVIEVDVKKLMIVWKGIMIHVMEAAMMTDENIPSQLTCYNLLSRFIQNKNFEASPQMKELINSNLKAITQSQISYYSAFYFRFMTKIAKIDSKVIIQLMPFVMTQIKNCEQMRGTGVDMKLRGLYDQLQMSLNKSK